MPVKCPKCNRLTNEARPLCIYCGAPIMELPPCPGCGRPTKPGARKCMYCGAAIPAPAGGQPGAEAPRIVQVHVVDPSLSGEEMMQEIMQRIDDLRTRGRVEPQELGLLSIQTLNQAGELWQQGRVEDALKVLDLGIRREPEVARLHLLRGTILTRQRRHAEALQAIDRALALDEADPQAWFRKADLLDEMGHPDQALACYDQALVLNPSFVDGWIDRGRALERLGKDDSAIASYAKAISFHPKNAIAWNNRGSCLLRKGQAEDAEASFRRAVEIDPRMAHAWINCGIAVAEQKRPRAEVVACYRKALEADPSGAKAAYERAWNLSKQEDYETALPLWEALAEAFPDDPMIRLQCKSAQVIVDQGGRSKAEMGRDQLQNSSLAELLQNAAGYEAAREGDLALEHYRAALVKKPGERDALHGVARVLQRSAGMEDALEAWEGVLKYYPDDVEGLAGRAEALVELRRFGDALNTAFRARSLNPRHAPAWLQEGRALVGLKRTADGVKALRQALTLDPKLGRGWLDLGGAEAQLGRWTSAAEAWRRFLAIGEPAGFVTGVKERELPRAERIARLLQEGQNWDAAAWAAKGSALHRAGEGQDLEGADICFSAALRLQPRQPEWLLERGSVLAGLNRHNKAAACADALLTQEPDHRDALILKGMARFQQGQQLVAARNYGQSEEDPGPLLAEAAHCLKRAVALGADPGLMQTAGMALFLAGRPDEAQGAMEQAPPLADGSRLAVAGGEAGVIPPADFHQQGLELLNREQIEPAAKAFLQSVKADPKRHESWSLLGLCMLRLGKPQEALKALDHAVHHCPDQPGLWSNRANILSDLGRHADALESAQQALGLSPRMPQAWGNRGRALAELGRLDEALAAFTEAQRHGPSDPTHGANIALTLAKMGRLHDALPIAEEALRLGPNHPLAQQVYWAIRNDLEKGG